MIFKTWRRAAIAAITVGVLLAGGALLLPEPPAAAQALAPGTDTAVEVLSTEVGDTITFHFAVFDDEGRMLFSTRASDRAELENVQRNFSGDFFLPPADDLPQRHEVTKGLRPLPFLDRAGQVPVGDALLGKPVGHVAAFPVVSSPVGYDKAVTLERDRGPFNVSLTARTATLANLTRAGDPDLIRLDGMLLARVVEKGDEFSRVQILVEDGQVIPIRMTSLSAVVDMEEGQTSFRLRLDAKQGTTFSLLEACPLARYVLEPGSYRVESVEDDAIRLTMTPLRWPQLIDRDLMMFIEIVDIEKKEEKTDD